MRGMKNRILTYIFHTENETNKVFSFFFLVASSFRSVAVGTLWSLYGRSHTKRSYFCRRELLLYRVGIASPNIFFSWGNLNENFVVCVYIWFARKLYTEFLFSIQFQQSAYLRTKVNYFVECKWKFTVHINKGVFMLFFSKFSMNFPCMKISSKAIKKNSRN